MQARRPSDPAAPDAASPTRRRVLALGLVALLAPQAPALAQAWNLQALMRELGTRKSAQASFHETRTLSMLSAPLESSGTLRFVAPDFLEMRTLQPSPQTFTVQGGQVSLELGGKRHAFALDQQPQVAALIDGLRATLDGDLAGLQRAYATRLRGRRRLWTLELVPRASAARGRISEIDVSGSAGTVLSIAIYQANGDHSLMTLREMPAP